VDFLKGLIGCVFYPIHFLLDPYIRQAPEVAREEPFDPYAADVWSAGVCLYVSIPCVGASTFLFDWLDSAFPG